MDWVKLSARYYMDPGVADLPDADAEIMFVRSLAYAGAEETSGFIPSGIVPSLSRRRRYEASVDAVVAAGLWLPLPRGYQIARWEEWQAELEAIAQRRSADRERKRRERAKKKTQVNGTSRDMSADSPQDSLSVSVQVGAESGEERRTSADTSRSKRRPLRGGADVDRWYASGKPDPATAARGAAAVRAALPTRRPDA